MRRNTVRSANPAPSAPFASAKKLRTRRLWTRACAALLVAVASAGFAVASPIAASADAPTGLVKRFVDQEPLGLGLGSQTVFTIEAPAIRRPGFATTSWGVRDVIDSRLSHVSVTSVELVNPADPTDVLAYSDDPTGALGGYLHRFEPSTGLLDVWLSAPALFALHFDPAHASWYPRVTVSAVVDTLGDGTIRNLARGGSSLLRGTQLPGAPVRLDGDTCVEVADPDDPRLDNPPCLASGDPAHFPDQWESEPVVTRWGAASVRKIDADSGAPLPGAQFEVYPAADPYAATCEPIPAPDAGPVDVAVAGGTVTQFESDDSGMVRVPGLFVDQDATADGHRCYVLTETRAPTGYTLPTGGAQNTALRIEVGSGPPSPLVVANVRSVTEVTPVAPAVTPASCPVPGQETAPQVTLPTTTGIAYAIVGEIAPGSTVQIEARAEAGYRLAESDGWTGIGDVLTFSIVLDEVDCDVAAVETTAPATNAPVAGHLAVTGGAPSEPVWWAGAVLLLVGTTLVLLRRFAHR